MSCIGMAARFPLCPDSARTLGEKVCVCIVFGGELLKEGMVRDVELSQPELVFL